jgi:hypothetical protein
VVASLAVDQDFEAVPPTLTSCHRRRGSATI